MTVASYSGVLKGALPPGQGSLRSSTGRGVTDAGVLGPEEALQEDVHAEQAVAAERDHLVVGPREVAVASQGRERLREPAPDVDPVLVGEVRRPDRPALQLQHELADEPLVRPRPVRPPPPPPA